MTVWKNQRGEKAGGPRSFGAEKRSRLPLTLQQIADKTPSKGVLDTFMFRVVSLLEEMTPCTRNFQRFRFRRDNEITIHVRWSNDQWQIPVWCRPRIDETVLSGDFGIWMSQSNFSRSSVLWFKDQWYVIEGVSKHWEVRRREIFHLSKLDSLEGGDEFLELAYQLLEKN